MKPFLKALRLSVPTYLCGTIVFGMFFWTFLFLSVVASFGGVYVFLWFALAFLAMGALWYLLLGVVWRFILHLLWDAPPQWMMPCKTWREVGINFAGCMIASLPVSIPLIVALSAKSYLRMQDIPVYFRVDSAAIAIRFYWLWLLTATLYYQFLSRRQPVQPKVCPIETDLNNLKSEMGLKKMRDPKRGKFDNPS